MPNKSPEPTAVGAVSSAVAVHVASRRWLSYVRRLTMRSLTHISLVVLLAILGCASPKNNRSITLVAIASYKLMDEDAVVDMAVAPLQAKRIMVGLSRDENTNDGFICVDPSKQSEARNLLEKILSSLTAEQKDHAFQIVEP